MYYLELQTLTVLLSLNPHPAASWSYSTTRAPNYPKLSLELESQLIIINNKMAELSEELSKIEEQIGSIENEIKYLIGEKHKLLERRDLIRAQLQSIDDLNTCSMIQQADIESDIDWENGRFPWTDELSLKLLSKFSISSFRHLQLSCINATLSNHDVILLMPTGGGKSLCYQLPAVINEGFTLVISPLVSLMQDQLRSVKQIGIESHMLSADSSKSHVKEVHSCMIDKNNHSLKLVYVTPEKVSKSKLFISKLEKAYEVGRLARIVIDEVHCASQWGHDFRPDYKVLGILKRQFPNSPIIGLTATATMKVLDDCKSILRLDSCIVFKASYNRSNLFYEIKEKPVSYKNQVKEIVDLIQQKFDGKSGEIIGSN